MRSAVSASMWILPLDTRSSMTARAMYGLTALAPYPMSNAKCMVSLGSPDSTTNAVWILFLRLIRC